MGIETSIFRLDKVNETKYAPRVIFLGTLFFVVGIVFWIDLERTNIKINLTKKRK